MATIKKRVNTYMESTKIKILQVIGGIKKLSRSRIWIRICFCFSIALKSRAVDPPINPKPLKSGVASKVGGTLASPMSWV